MFFSITSAPDDRFPCQDKLGQYFFNHDRGWRQTNKSWIKGYRHPDYSGNWAEISFLKNTLILDHGPYRSFPLWWDVKTGILTNLLGNGQSIWATQKIKIVDGQLTIEQSSTVTDAYLDSLDRSTALDLICDRLIYQANYFRENFDSYNKKIFVSGGVDTVTLLSLLQKVSAEFELVDYEYLQYDWFLNHNLESIKKNHWGYSQIHHWTEPTILATGGCGDEFMLRGPTTIALWAAWHNMDIIELVKNSNKYHSWYFQKSKNIETFQTAWNNRHNIRSQYPTEFELYKQILNININDHQHWHLGQTLTWTPFLDLELTKIILQLPAEDILSQILNADISRDIIKRLSPSNLSMLGQQKNYNTRQNLVGFETTAFKTY